MSTNDSSHPGRKIRARLARRLLDCDGSNLADLRAILAETMADLASVEAAGELELFDQPAVAPLYGFDHFWQAWPLRGGKRLYRGKAEQYWAKLTLAERKAAWRGAVNYATACANGTQGAMDAFRWLRDRSWVDWQDAPTAPARGSVASVNIVAAAERIRTGQSALLPALPPARAIGR